MKKDPAFLFYSKDWLEGTAELYPDEKGVYIDLLCYQHQRGYLPSDTGRLARMVGLRADDFDKIWAKIRDKFEPEADDRLVNRTLQRLATERSQKGIINKISGTFASVLRKYDLPKKDYLAIRAQFKIDDFLPFHDQNLTERLTEWLGERCKSIANANGNANGNEDVNTVKAVGARRAECLFKDSEFFEISKFRAAFVGTPYEGANLDIYHEEINNWSNGKGAKKVDWIATARNWMLKEHKNGTLLKQGQTKIKNNGNTKATEAADALERIYPTERNT